jgi:hypothetical protein
MAYTVILITFILALWALWSIYRDSPYRCWHPGCRKAAHPCYLPEDAPRGNIEYYCNEHAFRHGFCSGCGEFWAGIGSFEVNGWCDHCFEEIQSDQSNEYMDEWEWY